MDPDAALACLRETSVQVAAAHAQSLRQKRLPAHIVVGEYVPDFIARLGSQSPPARKEAITKFMTRAARYGSALVEGSTVYLFYAGRGRRVSVPGDLNGWDPRVDVMTRVRGTNFHYLAIDAPSHSRFEYKLAVDSVWVLDPCNRQRAVGGSGPNSEVWMPAYRPPDELNDQTGLSRGSIRAFALPSKLLKRSQTVFVYVPYGFGRLRGPLPSLYVLDGGDYVSLGMMSTILNNMIARRRIPPVVVAFLEPRTDVTRPRTSKRMKDYTMSDTFVSFLDRELRPELERMFNVSRSARNRGIMGSSLGALEATYAAYKHPQLFSLCGAQSPAYWWRKQEAIRMIARGPVRPVRFYLDTGTIQDALETTRALRDVLRRKGYRYLYAEHPEGHNWAHWRADIPRALEFFWGIR